jgi:tetratricopeptide (TPR) repeat protein
LLLSMTIQARDFVGRRAVSYLPRSYKLWKCTWEFCIQQVVLAVSNVMEDEVTATRTNRLSDSSNCTAVVADPFDRKRINMHQTVKACRVVIQCMERAILTLSSYPRLWIVYLQFLLQYPIEITILLQQQQPVTTIPTTTNHNRSTRTNSYHTFVRQTLNRALQSIAIAQHNKLWSMSGMIEYFFNTVPPQLPGSVSTNNDREAENNNSNNQDGHHHPHYYWPYESMNRIVCRYTQQINHSNTTMNTKKNFPFEYATWCEQYHKYGHAALTYVALLNSHAKSGHSRPSTEFSTTTSPIETTAGINNPSTIDSITVATTTNSDQQQRDMIYQSFMELVAQHSDAIDAVHIPWETILQTTIRNEIQRSQMQSVSSQHLTANAKNATTTDETIANTSAPTSSSSSMLGLLYTWYGSAYIQRGQFDMAMSIYEEGLLHVYTVRDFTIVYTAYLSLVEGLLNVYYNDTSLLDATELEDDTNDNDMSASTRIDTVDQEDWDLLLLESDLYKKSSTMMNATMKVDAMEMAMARAEHLTTRRPLLLNAVKIRQNPNDCDAYMERAELFMGNDQTRNAVTTLEEALRTIVNGGTLVRNNPKKETSTRTTIPQLVRRLVQIYEETMQDLEAVRNLFDRVCRQRTTAIGIVKVEELADCWASWIEFELKHEQYDEALSLSRQSIASNPLRNKKRGIIDGKSGSSGAGTQHTTTRTLNLTKALRLWDLLLDLEESLGTIQTTKDAYNRAFEIKVITVQQIINFAAFLTEHKYFEESLSVYERGIELFGFPHPGAKMLWRTYIDAFLKRYKGTKVERLRNIFARCLESSPSHDCDEFFMLYGEFEEEYGLSKRALSVYKNMCEKVPVEDMYTAYTIFINKTIKHLGVAATRDIYQDAIEKLTKSHPRSVVPVCRDFAHMEVELNQIDRARAIYVYGAQSADPRRLPEYWKDWNDFEIANGNEDTFREMLRVKRSVEAAFSTVNYNAIGMTENVSNFTNEEAMSMIAAAEGMDYNDTTTTSSAAAISGFVPSTANKRAATTLDDVEERVAKLRKVTGAELTDPAVQSNNQDYIDDDEIALDEIDAEIEEAANGEDAEISTYGNTNFIPSLVHDVVPAAGT